MSLDFVHDLAVDAQLLPQLDSDQMMVHMYSTARCFGSLQAQTRDVYSTYSTEASHEAFSKKVLAHAFINNFFVRDMGVDCGNVNAVKEASSSTSWFDGAHCSTLSVDPTDPPHSYIGCSCRQKLEQVHLPLSLAFVVTPVTYNCTFWVVRVLTGQHHNAFRLFPNRIH